MATYRLLITIGILLLQAVNGQTIRSTSTCSVPLCPSNNTTNSSCSSANTQQCYGYTISGTNLTLCGPSVSCSLFEPCTDNVICSSNTSICLSSTCCPQPICMPVSLAVTTCAATLPTTLPNQCYNNVVNSDPTRNVAYTQTSNLCDQTEFSTPRWVRFSGSAGTRLANTVPGMNRCGTTYPGYVNDTLPTTAGETRTSVVCYYYYGSCQWQSTIMVTNCITYFVYYLSSPPTCNLRYCTV